MCVQAHAVAQVRGSEDAFGCWSLASTLFQAGSLPGLKVSGDCLSPASHLTWGGGTRATDRQCVAGFMWLMVAPSQGLCTVC